MLPQWVGESLRSTPEARSAPFQGACCIPVRGAVDILRANPHCCRVIPMEGAGVTGGSQEAPHMPLPGGVLLVKIPEDPERR